MLLPTMPPELVAEKVMVCEPTLRLLVLTDPPLPSTPLMLETHWPKAVMFPSTGSVMLPTNDTDVPATTERPLLGLVIVTAGAIPSVAAVLVAEPSEFVTTTSYWPTSCASMAAIWRVAVWAPEMRPPSVKGAPFFLHW